MKEFKSNVRVELSSIPSGECFEFDDSLYIRTAGMQAASITVMYIDSGRLTQMPCNSLVIPRNIQYIKGK